MNSSVRPSRTCLSYTSILFLSAVLFSSSSAQITIQQTALSNLLTVGTSISGYSSDIAPRTANIGKRGGPTVYDFSGYIFEKTGTLQVFAVDNIPALAAHYPAKAVVFGPSAADVDNNAIFLFGTDTVFVVGKASLTQERRFFHNRPYEPSFVFPLTYQTSRTYTNAHYDTVYNVSGSVASTNVSVGSDSSSVDGFGTLKILGRQFECLRGKLNHYTYSDKEFIFLTREGILIDVEMASSQPDTGIVQPTGIRLFVPSSIVSVGRDAMMPTNYSLGQNYPNPFNPTTAISYQLPALSGGEGSAFSFVKLSISDVLGRVVATLVDQVQPAGNHVVRWDASSMPSGLYFYRLQAKDYLETKKMILLR